MSIVNAVPLLEAAGGDYTISRSVRLRSSASAYFNRATASTGNQQKLTWSGWVKRGALANSVLFANGAASPDYIGFVSDALRISFSGGTTVIATNAVYRDPSAWYHVVLAIDTTQATAANRVLLWVNGVAITSFSAAAYPSQNANTSFNLSGTGMFIGQVASSTYIDGYLTEINYIDGQALTPTSFGAYNTTTGVWQPKKYTGTYGTNGFYLNFSDNSAATAAAIGKDSSGNGNNWTPNNISVTAGVTYDSMIDVPTMYADGGNGRGNYCVLNPLDYYDTAPTNANLTYSRAAGVNGLCAGSFVLTSGKWYWEVTIDTVRAASIVTAVGVSGRTAKDAGNNQLGFYSDQYAYVNNGNKANNNTYSAYGATYTTGDVIGIAYDADGGTLTFYKNGSTQGTAYSSIPAGNIRPMAYANGDTQSYNFGQRPFSYTPPTGFKALNTQNLPAVTINNGAQYMNAVLYTGNSGSQAVSNGVFQPDLTWHKTRSVSAFHVLFDSIRGASSGLNSNSTNAENTNWTGQSFTSTGFTVSNAYSSESNYNGATMVAWQWKESPTAGFDIVPYTFASTGTATISHNLGTAPKMVIAKRLNAVEQWLVYQSSGTTQSQYLGLNTTAAVASSANLWGSSAFTSSQFYFTATTGYQYIFYLFADVAGFSKFGSYTGNGSADGPFVYCGFRPRWVMMKRTDSTSDWLIIDTSRDTYNVATQRLYPDLSDAEGASGNILDSLSNGFKLRSANWNVSSGTYIFAAFAENPTKYALAR